MFTPRPQRFNGLADIFLGCQIRTVNAADMDDLEKRYAAMIRQIAELFPEEWTGYPFPTDLKVSGEERDSDGRTGRFYFEETSEPTIIDRIVLMAYDSDGSNIEIRFNIVDSRIKYAQWRRRDGRPVQRWPPPSVYPQALSARRPRV